MASFAKWKVGTITVPGSTGTVSVTGLGGTPAAVFFYGTNWLTEDTAVTTTGTGMFRGMAAPRYDSPSTIVQNVACVLPAGDAFVEANVAIAMQDTSGIGSETYRATLSSFDGDGFTVSFSAVTAGGYKIVYVALMDVDNVGGFIGTANNTITLGWKAGASLLHGSWLGPNWGDSVNTQQWYGGGAYPGTTGGGGWPGAGMTVMTFATSFSQQYLVEVENQPSGNKVCAGGHFSGPFLIPSNITATPSGGSLTDFAFVGDDTNGGMVVAWDDEDSWTGRLTPPASTSGQTTVSGLSFAPGLLIGYTVSDEPDGLGTGGRGAMGFSVATKDFQWTAIVDGVSSRGSFQSFQRGFSDCVSGTTVHAGTVELTGDGFRLTTQEDDIGPQDWVWHAFGHPEQIVTWIPQIYRRLSPSNVRTSGTIPSVRRGSSGAAAIGSGSKYVFTGYVLLETGDQIILEDGSGFLLL